MEVIRNCCKVLNFIDGEPEELWNKIKYIVQNECEKRLLKNQKREESKLLSQQRVDILRKRRKGKVKKDKHNNLIKNYIVVTGD